MNEEQLVALLQKHAIDTTRFGTGSAKTLTHLLAEIVCGETLLVEVDGRLVRRVSVLGVDVFADIDCSRVHLVEDRQVFTDGRERRRKMPTSISEKLHQGEDVLAAVTRALGEEIGISKFLLLTPIPHPRTEPEDSPSYPGILSEYTKYEVDVLIASSEYRVEGYQEIQPDKTTYFVWVAAERGGKE